MSEGKKKLGILGQIVPAVVVALIVGGSAPWWWKEFFGKDETGTAVTPPEPPLPPTTNPPDDPGEVPGREYPVVVASDKALDGDEIIHYRVIDTSVYPGEAGAWQVKLELEYARNLLHGAVYLGAELLPRSAEFTTGHNSWGTVDGPDKAVEEHRQGAVIRGLQRTRIVVTPLNPPQFSEELRIFMYSAGGEIVSKTYEFHRQWPPR